LLFDSEEPTVPARDRRPLLARRPRLFAGGVVALALASWLSAGVLAWQAWEMTFGLPGHGEIGGIGDMARSTLLYDAADRPVFTIFKEQRVEVPLARMSEHLVSAVLSVEDQRFYDHHGVDLIRIPGALLANLREGRRAQGGSTITQQLARQSLLTRDKTLRRKVQEALLAARIEAMYSKDEILELYLNKVYFGDGLYGVEAASLGFFGKSAADLDVAEAALLAGLIKSPSTWAPTINLEQAVARRNVVLATMVDSGAIDQETFERLREEEVGLQDALRRDEPYGLYFKEQVRRDLVERFGWQRVYEGGLHVYTTIDSDLQQAAEKMVEEGLIQIEGRRGYPHVPRAEADEPDYLQAALVAVDAGTGFVRAMVGGRSFADSSFNRAVQARRQPGSAFKPFVYAAALEAGLTPATLIENLDDPVLTAQGGWVPEEDHSSGATALTLRAALRTSSNRAAVQLLQTVGISQALHYAERLHVEAPPGVPSLALGAGEVTLQAITAAYAAFANGGYVRPPSLIRRVEDGDGEVLYEHVPQAARAVSETTAFLMASMLADVVNAGTASRARREGFTLPAGGKTGTTNRFVEAWFVGFTPGLVTGVWVGFDQPQPIAPNAYAGEIAVPIWARFMREATRGQKPRWLDRPASVVGVNVCRLSGRLPAGGCEEVEVMTSSGETETRSLVYTEFFVRGSQPSDRCPLHPLAGRSIMGRIAGLFTGGEGERPAGGAAEVAETAEAAPAGPAAPAGEENAEPERRRRSIWSRIFGTRDRERSPPQP
jgi:1A family penicillin-binding protein